MGESASSLLRHLPTVAKQPDRGVRWSCHRDEQRQVLPRRRALPHPHAAPVGRPAGVREAHGTRQRVDGRVGSTGSHLSDDGGAVGGGIASQRANELDPDRERPERLLVPGESQIDAPAVSVVGVPERQACMRIRRAQSDDGPLGRQRVPAGQGPLRPREQRRQTLRRPEPVSPGGTQQAEQTVVPPLAVAVEPFDPVHRQRPVGPGQGRPRR